jgi:uncharacterized protein (TIGR00255 family)
MIKSMTAFAGTEHSRDNITITVEIRGYNSRYLDTALRLPSAYGWLEDIVKQTVSRNISRGRLEIRIGINAEEEKPESFSVDTKLADAYHEALKQLKNRFAIEEPIGISHLTGLNGIIENTREPADTEVLLKNTEGAVKHALDCFDAMRIEEGKAMAKDLSGRIALIKGFIEEIDRLRHGLAEAYQQKLHSKIMDLTGGSIEIDQARIAQEAAIIADKSDISEELSRSRSHVEQFLKIMDSDEPAGKPLNFLLQEFSREFNTMGVKAGSAQISHIVVSAKTELEKLREQVQNIE